MKDPALSNKVMQKLTEFENLEDIQASEGWSYSLMNRISSEKPYSSAGFSYKTAVVILLVVLVNLGFIMNAVLRDSWQSLTHNRELQVISSELLINPFSINN